MAKPESIADLRALCAWCGKQNKLRSISKAVIENIIMADHGRGDGDETNVGMYNNDDIACMLRSLKQDMKEVKDSNKKVIDALARIDTVEKR